MDYTILFRAAAATLRRIAADPKHLGAKIGFLAVLHTWGQNLQHHPHLHRVVPGGSMGPIKTQLTKPTAFAIPPRVVSKPLFSFPD